MTERAREECSKKVGQRLLAIVVRIRISVAASKNSKLLAEDLRPADSAIQ